MRFTTMAFLIAVVGLPLPVLAQADRVKDRQAKMKAITAAVKTITDQQRRRAPNWSLVQPAAGQLDALGKTMPGWFSSGTHGGKTLPTAFSDKASFAVELKAFERAASALPLAARAKDKAQLTARMDALRTTCVSCHKKFRQKK